MMMVPLALSLALALARQTGPPAPAAQQEEKPPKLTELSIEDLMKIEVTSASKKPERLVDTPSAIFVIRSEDLQRSGVRSIPEALRMVPGLEVSRIDGNKWAVSSRGFAGMFANKLLVLIDGRSVYNPTFSGVHWDIQDVLFEDVDRIEVIRGPGATVWGANAVNGVINIITKKASETQGGMVSAGGGTRDRAFGAGRVGGKLGTDAYYRVFAKAFDRADSEGAHDSTQFGHTGFRVDWAMMEKDSLTLQGDYYKAKMGVDHSEISLQPPYLNPMESSSTATGGNLLARWEHTYGEANVLTGQFYYDRADRDAPWSRENRDTLDFDLHQQLPLFEGNNVTWGLGYRWTRGDFGNSITAQISPIVRVDQIASAFVQDEIDLLPKALRLTLGAKFEYNNYTRTEFQPNARLMWTVSDDQVVWAAASRAVRTPAPSDTLARFNQTVIPPGAPGFPPTLISIFGDPRFRSEELRAFELGYRVVPSAGLTLDVTGFYNKYAKLRSIEPGTPGFEIDPAPAHGLVPLFMRNEMAGTTYGLELASHWQVIDGWRLQLSYTYFRMDLKPDAGSLDTTSEASEKADPASQVYVRSSFDLSKTVRFDAIGRYVSRLSSRNIDSYVEADARFAWDITDSMEFSLVGQNLAQRRHFESNIEPLNIQPAAVERAVYASIQWRF